MSAAVSAANIGSLSTAVQIEPGAAAPALRSGAVAHALHARSRWWVEVLTIGWLCWIYDAIANLAPLRLHIALAHAGDILGLERTLHIDPEHALDRWLAGHHTLGLALSDYYDNAHFVVTLGLLGWLWWRRADIYRPLRNSLVAVNLVGFLIFWLYPVAPPRMLPGFVDVVSASGAIGSFHQGALASQANELAAMPSLHIAWACWCTLALWRMSASTRVRALALAYPCLTALVVLATGNHYVLDMVAGVATLAAAELLRRAWSTASARASAALAVRVPRALNR